MMPIRAIALVALLLAAVGIATAVTRPAAAEGRLTCDGTTNDGPALQALIDQAAAGSSPDIQLPWGVCLLGSGVTIKDSAVHLRGHGWGESGPATAGTWLKATSTAIHPLTVSSPGASGSTIDDVGLVQAHPAPAPGWSPAAYPPFIAVISSPGFKARNIYGYGVYDGFALYNVGRFELSDISGEFFHNIIQADHGLDLARIVDVHDWPFWTDAQHFFSGAELDAVIAWQQANKDAIVLGRQDGAFLDRIFTFAGRSGLRFITGAEGGVGTGIQIGSIECDGVTHCVMLTGAPGVTAKLGQLNSFGQSGVSSGVPLPGANAVLVDSRSSLNLQGGDIRSGLDNTNVVQVDSSTLPSSLYLHSVLTYAMVGARASSIFQLAASSAGAPHIVYVDQPLNISLSSGSYLAGANWATTDAKVRIPGLDYQVIEKRTAAAFEGTSLAIENARPKVFIEADDGNVIGSLHIILPTSPDDGLEASFTTNVPIAAVSVTDPNGRPVIASSGPVAAGATTTFKWTNTGSAIVWFRM